MDENKFLSDAKEKRKKNMEELVLKVLAKMLKDDVQYLDAHYIENRTLEIIEKTIKKLKFTSEDVQKARRAFLDVLLDGAKQQLFGYEDDYQTAKENLQIKSEKHKAKEVLAQIERMRKKVPKDETEERNMKCEPICQLVAGELLSKEWILKDEDFVNGCIEMDNKFLMETLYKVLFGEFFDQLVASLDRSYRDANEKNWGCTREKIRLSQIDNRLKNANTNSDTIGNGPDTPKDNEPTDNIG